MDQRGILIIAHGSRNPDWVRLVDSCTDAVDTDLPIVTSFLELVEGRSIEDGIRELEAKGVKEIFVVPLFVSSGSTHIEEIQYRLGLKEQNLLSIEEPPYSVNASITLSSPMDDHPLIAQILQERAEELSENPSEEAVLLVGHGSEGKGFHDKWVTCATGLAEQLQERMKFANVSFAFLHPDQVRENVLAMSQKHRVMILPLFLSEGYFTKQVIPSRVKGLSYSYNGKTYLPSSLVSRWIEQMIEERLSTETQS